MEFQAIIDSQIRNYPFGIPKSAFFYSNLRFFIDGKQNAAIWIFLDNSITLPDFKQTAEYSLLTKIIEQGLKKSMDDVVLFFPDGDKSLSDTTATLGNPNLIFSFNPDISSEIATNIPEQAFIPIIKCQPLKELHNDNQKKKELWEQIKKKLEVR